MFEDLKTDAQILRDNPPGQRFQARYRYRKEENPLPRVKRMSKIVIGIGLLPVGVILWFIPGSGWLVIFLGLALLAGESQRPSLFLDKAEMSIRKGLAKISSRFSG